MATKPTAANFNTRLEQIAAMTPGEIAALPHGELLVWYAVSAMLGDSLVAQGAFAKLSDEADLRKQLSSLVFGNDNVGSDAGTRFLDPGYGNNSTSPTASISITAARSGTLRNFFVRHHSATSSSNTVTYIVQVNGVDTPITVTLAANAVTTVGDVVNTRIVAQGDRITVKVTKSGPVPTGNLKAVANMEIA